MSGLKQLVAKVPGARPLYAQVRGVFPEAGVREVFAEPRRFQALLRAKGPGHALVRTRSGLEIGVRRNIWDARILRETFVDRPYMRHYTPGPKGSTPTVVDVGGYIGDFALYAASELGARVFVFEPTDENFALLRENIERNNLAGRIEAINLGVSAGDPISLNVEVDGQEVHASAYWYEGAERRQIDAISLDEARRRYNIGAIDLLKIDCEGGEYDIIPALSAELLRETRHVVFEWHRMPGHEQKLEACLDRLREAGFSLIRQTLYVFAARP